MNSRSDVKPGTRVRIVASINVHGGKLGTTQKRLITSGLWKITLDEIDSFGRQLFARCNDDELVAVEDEKEIATWS